MREHSVLTHEETDKLKGLLILLVIFGHIEQFFSFDNGVSQMSLYSFHVVSFFFLPFLFNNNTLNFLNIKKNIRRIYVPYTVIYLISVLIYSFLFHKEFSIDIFTAWFIGTGPLVKDTAGFAFFWFFPALISTIILLMLYNTLSDKLKKFFLLSSISTHILIPLIPSVYLIYFPFGLYVPLYLFIIGISIKYIYNNFVWRNYLTISLFLIFSLLLYFLYGSRFNLASPLLPNIIKHPIEFILHDFVFIIGFFTMIFLSKSYDFFIYFGKYSLAFFTIHPFIIQFVNRLYDWNSILDAVIKFIVVVVITYLIVKLIYLLNVNKIIYPR